MLRAKAALSEGEGKVKEGEDAVEKAKKLVPKEGKKFTMEKVNAFDEACASASKLIRTSTNAIQPVINSAPAKVKAELQKLVDRKNAAQAAMVELAKDTKERREEALSEHFLEE